MTGRRTCVGGNRRLWRWGGVSDGSRCSGDRLPAAVEGLRLPRRKAMRGLGALKAEEAGETVTSGDDVAERQAHRPLAFDELEVTSARAPLYLPPTFPHPTPLGRHRAPSWASWAGRQVSTSQLCYMWQCASIHPSLLAHPLPHPVSTCPFPTSASRFLQIRRGYTPRVSWFTSSYSRKQHIIVKQLYLNLKK